MDAEAARFWDKVDRRGPADCWPWLAGKSDSGHGSVRWQGRVTGAHRVAFILTKGDIPAGRFVCHTCDVGACVNPAHLRLGTVQDNNADRKRRGRYGTTFRKGATILPPVPATLGRWKGGTPARPVAERFAESIEVDAAGCWIWRRARLHFGHGAMKVAGRMVRAHRVAWELYRGAIPKGAQVLHRCDVPSCCNPDHLRLGSHVDNMRDMAERGRAAKGERNHFGKVAYRGEANGFAKLTAAAVRDIRRTVGRKTLDDMAAKYGVQKAAVWKVRAGLTWRHVEPRTRINKP